jgi:hypothetical protein
MDDSYIKFESSKFENLKKKFAASIVTIEEEKSKNQSVPLLLELYLNTLREIEINLSELRKFKDLFNEIKQIEYQAEMNRNGLLKKVDELQLKKKELLESKNNEKKDVLISLNEYKSLNQAKIDNIEYAKIFRTIEIILKDDVNVTSNISELLKKNQKLISKN